MFTSSEVQGQGPQQLSHSPHPDTVHPLAPSLNRSLHMPLNWTKGESDGCGSASIGMMVSESGGSWCQWSMGLKGFLSVPQIMPHSHLRSALDLGTQPLEYEIDSPLIPSYPRKRPCFPELDCVPRRALLKT